MLVYEVISNVWFWLLNKLLYFFFIVVDDVNWKILKIIDRIILIRVIFVVGIIIYLIGKNLGFYSV